MRGLGTVRKDWLRANPSWPAWLSSMMLCLALWMRGEQWMLYTLTLASLWYNFPQYLYSQIGRIWLGWMTVSWVENCLANEAQGVGIYGMKFNWRPPTNSVSHLLLSSILFNVRINDLADGTECTFSQFEDDAKIRAGGWYTQGQGLRAFRGQAGKIGWQEPHESQQRQMQGPAPGRE